MQCMRIDSACVAPRLRGVHSGGTQRPGSTALPATPKPAAGRGSGSHRPEEGEGSMLTLHTFARGVSAVILSSTLCVACAQTATETRPAQQATTAAKKANVVVLATGGTIAGAGASVAN